MSQAEMSAGAIIINTMYKVTIQSTPVQQDNWRVVASGRWTPGQPPQLDHVLPEAVVESLFNIIPSATEKSGRNQMQDGDTFYAVVFRRLSNPRTIG